MSGAARRGEESAPFVAKLLATGPNGADGRTLAEEDGCDAAGAGDRAAAGRHLQLHLLRDRRRGAVPQRAPERVRHCAHEPTTLSRLSISNDEECCDHFRAFRRAASDCYTELSDFIQNLNADVELYRAIRAVSEDEKLMAAASEEQRRMAELLRNEYERDGIHLSSQGRRRVIGLQNDITQLSMDFQRTLFSAREYIEVPSRLVRPLPHSVWAMCERKLSNPMVMRVPTDVHVMNTVLKWIGDPKVRRDMYVAANSCAVDNLEVRSLNCWNSTPQALTIVTKILEELRSKRHELAELLGFQSYAHLATRSVGSSFCNSPVAKVLMLYDCGASVTA